MNDTSAPRVLRIGILGAAQIAPNAICIPAAVLGHRLVVIGSRELSKAEAFKERWGVENAVQGYEAVVNHPDVDLVYNALPNSHHAFWNIAALKAGKNVLSEKPFASNYEEAKRVADVAAISTGKIIEGFHYQYHPSIQRAIEIAHSGELGNILTVTSAFNTSPPPDSDICWSLALAGGAMMDLGCYSLHIQRRLSLALFGEEPTLISALSREGRPGVDTFMEAKIAYKNGAVGTLSCSMESTHFESTLRIVGSEGELFVPSFVQPGMDDSLVVTIGGTSRTERTTRISSYTWQLQAFAEQIGGQRESVGVMEDALANAAFIDDIYRAAGMATRPKRIHPAHIAEPSRLAL
ncbi:MAG TPA: Gfo/Idh/MocA family oxidoreductase [Candidatus Paceibacterota bacterium]|nr:Gfo/Idh/MocA family oxidoreductase [Candidatus Paceibacterota bacterium]